MKALLKVGYSPVTQSMLLENGGGNRGLEWLRNAYKVDWNNRVKYVKSQVKVLPYLLVLHSYIQGSSQSVKEGCKKPFLWQILFDVV